MSHGTCWWPGEDLAFVWPGGALVVGPLAEGRALSAGQVQRIWEATEVPVTLSGILQLLTEVLETSLLTLPPFAVVLVQGGAGQVAARGRFIVTLRAGEDSVDVTGAHVSTWSERQLDRIDGYVLARSVVDQSPPDGAAPDGWSLPLVTGVVRCSRLASGLAVAAPSRASVEPSPVAGVVAAPAGEVGSSLPAPDSVALSEPVSTTTTGASDGEVVPETSTPTGSTTVFEYDDAAVDSLDVEDASAAAGAAEPSLGTAPESGGPEAAASDLAPAPAPVGRYAAMWGDTVVHSVEDAAVRFDDEGNPSAPAPDPASSVEGGSLLISSVPGREGSAHPVLSAAGIESPMGDHDGDTVMGFSFAPVTPEPSASSGGGDTILARVCPAGHANRPHGAYCRECGAPLAGALTQSVPRPTLGVVRATTGEVVQLTGPILVGRSPRASRFQGTVTPRLLALPFPHVSSTHVEIRVEGWNVFAVDLNSRNGTFLRRRDEPVVRVTHPPLMLTDRDVLDFGHGVTLTFEGLP
ncbi:MAG: FHA domain-containing protein [Actinomycetales bacterium]|jgi:hypothetical protein|nr:FHA domain-containing protein [Actinomycetales bacterium]